MYRKLILIAFCLLPTALFSQIEATYLDKSFANGEGVFSMGPGTRAEALCEDPDRNRFYVAGSVDVNGTSQMFVRCYEMDGTLQTDWGNQGEVLLDFGLDAYAHSIALQTAGFSPSIFVAGHTDDGHFQEWAIAHLTIEGHPDSLFDLDGMRTLAIGPASIALDIEPLGSGGVLVSGEAGFNVAVAKFLFPGTLDGTFGTNGILTIDISSFDSQGKIEGDGTGTGLASDKTFLLASIGGNSEAYLTRFDQFGTIDQSFGVNGHLELPGLTGEVFPLIGLAFEQGKVGVAGTYSDTAANESIIYWQVDTTNWQVHGPQRFQAGNRHQLAGLAFQPNGHLQMAFKAEIEGHEAFGRFQVLPNNLLDADFGDAGVAIANLPTVFQEAAFDNSVGFYFQADGKGLFAATRDDLPQEIGIVARIGDKTIQYIPPSSSDTVLTFSLNHGNRDARLALAVDLDGDGVKDLLTHDNHTICGCTHLFRLDGTERAFFDPLWEESVTLPFHIHELDTLDVNGDGEWEILASCNGGLMLVNDTLFLIQPGNFTESVTGDLNGDGLTDIVALDRGGDSLWQFTSLGNGQFQQQVLLPNTEGISILELVDLENDQDLDLLVGGDATIAGGSNIWSNDGQGNLSISTFLGPSTTSDFEIADVNEDGIRELLYYELNGPAPALWALSLSNPIGAPIKLVDNVTGPGIFRNVDGISGMEALIFNKIDRTLYKVESLNLNATNATDSVGYFLHANLEFADGVRPDGTDFFMANFNNNQSQMQLFHVNWEDNPFNPHGIPPNSLMAYHPDDLTDLHLVDMDDDGDLDIVAVDPLKPTNDRTGSQLMVAENIGASGWVFKPYAYITALNNVQQVAPFDRFGDQHLEIAGKAEDALVFFEDLPGGGDMDFQDVIVQISSPQTSNPTELVVADFQQDGTIGMVEWDKDAGQLLYYDEVNWTGPTTPAGQAISLPASTPATFSIWDDDTQMMGGVADKHLYVVDIPSLSAFMTLNYFPQGNYAILPKIVDINRDQAADWLMVLPENAPNASYKLVAVINEGTGGLVSYDLLAFAGEPTALDYVYDPAWGHAVFLATKLPNQAPNVQVIQFYDNTLSNPAHFAASVPDASEISTLEAGDLNRDGIPDFVVLDPASGNIWVNQLRALPESEPLTSIEMPDYQASSLSLYPNPAKDRLMVSSHDHPIRRVVLRNIQGKQLKEWSSQSAKVALSLFDIPTGLYLVQTELGDGSTHMHKVLINR